MRILVTGCAGMIGYQLCKELLTQGHYVVGADNMNDYYDVELKEARLHELGILSADEVSESLKYGNFMFARFDIRSPEKMYYLLKKFEIDVVYNLAAQAGVRYSITHPMSYVDSNLEGFVNLLEQMNNAGVKHLVYASSSSVYGNADNEDRVFAEDDETCKPVSLYAATKKCNEIIVNAYAELHGIKAVGLRFFTVYGEYGRPDMAMYLFTKAILNGERIKLFNDGNLSRDFTNVVDVAKCIAGFATCGFHEKEAVYNVGYGKPIKIFDLVKLIEKATGKKAKLVSMPMQQGDVLHTWADTTRLERDLHYTPSTSIEEGVIEYVRWHQEFYKPKN